LALPFRTMNAAAAEGLELAAPEIIRFSHGTTSARTKAYPVSLIPRVHDVCLVLRRSPAAAGRGPGGGGGGGGGGGEGAAGGGGTAGPKKQGTRMGMTMEIINGT